MEYHSCLSVLAKASYNSSPGEDRLHLLMGRAACMYNDERNCWQPRLCKWSTARIDFPFQLGCQCHGLLQHTLSRTLCFVLTSRWSLRVPGGIVVPITFFFFSPRFYLFTFRERGKGEKEGEKHQCAVASHVAPTGDLACNPGVCPDWIEPVTL